MTNKPTLGFNIACAQNQFKRCQLNWGRKKNLQQGNGMQQYGMQRRDPKPSPVPHLVCYLCYYRTLTYAKPSLQLVLLLLFLEKEGHFDQFYPKPKLLGPHGQHSCFVVAELWADRDM